MQQPAAERRGHRPTDLAGAAALVAIVTLVSRLVGFGRWLAFAHTVRPHDLGDAYNSANQIPNIVFEIVAGGALASITVPLLAGPIARGFADREARTEAARTVSALLTWTLLILVPLSALGMIFAGKLGHLLAGGHVCAVGYPSCHSAYAALVGRFLRIFLPQIPLYGIAVVLSATLQSGRRFLAPALAPLVSSVVVIGAYIAFGLLDSSGRNGTRGGAWDLLLLRHRDELVLSLGTTAGVLVLAASLVPAMRKTGMKLYPALRFPQGVASRARRLATAGIATLLAQQAAALAVVVLGNSDWVTSGSLSTYNLAWAVYVLPYAVLVVPIATTAFTELSTRAHEGEHDFYAGGVATTTRAVLLASAFGAGLLAATARPVARIFSGGGAAQMMDHGLLAFAPGLIGYGLIAHLGRVLYSAHRGRAAAVSIMAGWFVVVAADFALVSQLPGREAVTAFGIGNSIGMTVAGVLLIVAVVRGVGSAALIGAARSAVAGIAGGAIGAFAGAQLASAIGPAGEVRSLLAGLAAAFVATACFGAAVYAIDRVDLHMLLARARRTPEDA